MRKLYTLTLLAFSTTVMAQQSPAPKLKPAETPAATPGSTELAVQLAEAKVEIAKLVKKCDDLQLTVQLYASLSGVAARQAQEQKAIDDAEAALREARQKAAAAPAK